MKEGSRADRRGGSRSDDDAGSYEAAAAEIAAMFRMKLAGLRRRLRPWEMPAAARALRDEKQAALRALRDRRNTERRAKALERQRMRPPRAAPK